MKDGLYVVVEASLVNWLVQLGDAKVLIDPVPHIGRIDQEGKVRRGFWGKGKIVEGANAELRQGTRVLYRKEA